MPNPNSYRHDEHSKSKLGLYLATLAEGLKLAAVLTVAGSIALCRLRVVSNLIRNTFLILRHDRVRGGVRITDGCTSARLASRSYAIYSASLLA